MKFILTGAQNHSNAYGHLVAFLRKEISKTEVLR